MNSINICMDLKSKGKIKIKLAEKKFQENNNNKKITKIKNQV